MGYNPDMRDIDRGRAGWRAATVRALRWQTRHHRQVWLIMAGCGLVVLLAWLAIGGTWPELLPPAIVLAAYGAVMSYRLDRRRDARVAADWASSRGQAGT